MRDGKDVSWVQEVVAGVETGEDVAALLGCRAVLDQGDGFARC